MTTLATMPDFSMIPDSAVPQAESGDDRVSASGREATGGLNDERLALVEAVEAGDSAAAEKLMASLYPLVIRIIRGRISSRLSEEDVAQDVFVKVFRKLHQYRRDVPIAYWVSRIAVTTCLNAMRGKRLRLELRRADLSEAEEEALERAGITGPEASPAEALASRELLGRLLDHLSPKDRLVIEMLELEGRTSEEAAKILKTNAVALRVRATRARRKLRQYLNELLGDMP